MKDLIIGFGLKIEMSKLYLRDVELVTQDLPVGVPLLLHLHLADVFIQSDLHCIQAIHLLSVCVPWELNPQPLLC